MLMHSGLAKFANLKLSAFVIYLIGTKGVQV